MFIAPTTQRSLRSGGAECLNLLDIDGAPSERQALINRMRHRATIHRSLFAKMNYFGEKKKLERETNGLLIWIDINGPANALLRCILSLSASDSDLSLNLPCFVRNVLPRDCDHLVLILGIAIDRCGQLSEQSRHPPLNSRSDLGGKVL